MHGIRDGLLHCLCFGHLCVVRCLDNSTRAWLRGPYRQEGAYNTPDPLVPSLKSNTATQVCYGIGLIGLIVSGAFYTHVAAKYLFVRILRNSRHLQSNSVVHWTTWLGCTFGLSALAFILAQAIPIFNYLIAITGSFCFAPLALMVPAWIWMYDHPHYLKSGAKLWQKGLYAAHVLLMLIGAFICVGGTYATIQSIVDAYNSGTIGEFRESSLFSNRSTMRMIFEWLTCVSPQVALSLVQTTLVRS
jgi:hypothetical protein